MNPDLLEELAASTDRAVQALVVSWLALELTTEEFVALATAAIERAEAEGAALADLAVAASLGAGAMGVLPVATGRARAIAEALVKEADPTSLITIRRLPATDPAEYLQAIRKELEEAGHDSKWYADRHRLIKVLERSQIETRAEVLDATQTASGAAVKAHGAPWERRLNRGACELCQDLAGDVLPSHADMYRHKGCGCTQRPIKKEN